MTDDVLSRIPRPVTWWEDGEAIRMLDQTLLPGEERYLRLERVEEVAEAISSLRVRGAPAIGIAAAFGMALGLKRRLREGIDEPERGGAPGSAGSDGDGEDPWTAAFLRDREILAGTRPTAVNLEWALNRLSEVYAGADGGPAARARAVIREAGRIAEEDRELCRLMGKHGLEVIPEKGAGILTHCNAGALATGGMGTALAPIYTAAVRGIPVRVFADETRPLLQGARLTAWELSRAGVDVTVLTDSMAGALMAAGKVNLVITGTDRVAANGDVANKIGTYGVALLAREHGIPFYVASPRSTFDLASAGGGEIPIEERAAAEVRGFQGRETVPAGVPVWNPAFDVTPAHLVTAFITDGGILRPPFPVAIAKLLDRDAPAE